MALRAGVAALALLAVLPGPAPSARTADAPRTFDHSHSWLASVLKARVRDGRVDYRGLRREPDLLLEYLRQVGSVPEATVRSWSRDEQLAFWLNAYNACALRIIMERYPIRPRLLASLRFPPDSIRQIHGVFDKLSLRVAGKGRSLDDIEHGLIRPEFKDARVHLALVCAAKGCPLLREEPYAGASLDRQLEDQARRFIQDPLKFRLLRGAREVRVSPIFKWYGEDFVPRYAPLGPEHAKDPVERAILGFARRYLDDTDRRFIDAGGYRLRWLDYDWSLNEK